MKEELLFALDIRKNKKPVRVKMSEHGSLSNFSSKSIDATNGLNAGYQIGLERLNK